MIRLVKQVLLKTEARYWGYASGLTVLGLLAVAATVGVRLWQATSRLRRARTTYAAKVAWASNKDELVRRVKQQEAAVAEAQDALLGPDDVGEFTREVGAVARRVGCLVQSVQSMAARPVSDQGSGGPRRRGKGSPQDHLAEVVEWPVRMCIRGSYKQICSLVGELHSHRRYLSVTQLALHPNDQDRKFLTCDIDVAGYELQRKQLSGNRNEV